MVRPGWDALMLRLERGDSDGVVAFKLDRFARRMTMVSGSCGG